MEPTKWTEEEQHQLEVALKKFPADKYSPLGRYIKMSALFPNKSVRDVALRVKWLSKREEKKKKKGHDSSKKRQDKGAKADSVAWQRQQQPSALGEKANQLYGPITEVLDQNIVVIKQIQQNMMHNKVRENTGEFPSPSARRSSRAPFSRSREPSRAVRTRRPPADALFPLPPSLSLSALLVTFRDNLMQAQGTMANIGGIMKQMPPLPAQLNTQLLQSVLPNKNP